MAEAACTIAEAARDLGISQRELRRWIQDGAPVERHGARGRGHCTLVRVSVLRAWRAAQAPSGSDQVTGALVTLAAEFPERMAAEIARAWRMELAPGRGAWWRSLTVDQAAAATMFEAAYLLAVGSVRQLVAEKVGEAALPPAPVYPESLSRMSKIARL